MYIIRLSYNREGMPKYGYAHLLSLNHEWRVVEDLARATLIEDSLEAVGLLMGGFKEWAGTIMEVTLKEANIDEICEKVKEELRKRSQEVAADGK